MFKSIFKPKVSNSKCIVLYCFDFDRKKAESIFYFLLEYFESNQHVLFNYGGFYDERYDDKYDKLERIKSKIVKHNWDEIVHFAFDDEDIRSANRKIAVDFTITRPIQTVIVIPNTMVIKLTDFLKLYQKNFKTIYGFSYSVDINNWPMAYADGDWQHGKSAIGVNNLSKNDFERWRSNCEKIQEGYVRDVYAENILSSVHLNRVVNGQKLSDLINSEKIGFISSINEDIFLWELNEENIKKAKLYINKSNLII